MAKATRQLSIASNQDQLLVEIRRRAGNNTIDASGVQSFWIEIDASLAELMLDRRPKNQRKIRRRVVELRARSMLDGRWRSDVSGRILFDRVMRLIDGQHRLAALIHANKTRPVKIMAMVSVLGTDEETLQLPIDQHTPRRADDFTRALDLRISNSVRAGLVREAIRFVHAAERSPEEQAHIAATHPCLELVVMMKCIHKASAGVVAGIARVLRYAANKQEAIDFFEAALSNNHVVNGVQNDQVRHLATWIASQHKGYSGDGFFREAAYRTIKAWNNHRSGHQTSIKPKYAIGYLTGDMEVVP